jgi:hypothetical protein
VSARGVDSSLNGECQIARSIDLNIERVLENWTSVHAIREIIERRQGVL